MMPARLFDRVVPLVRARVVALASGLVLLSLCLLLIADLSGLRDNGDAARRDAREARVEALAVRLSMLAASGGPAALEANVAAFVAQTPGAEGAVLVSAASGERRAFGQAVDVAALERGASLVHVPIAAGERVWGELTVAFASRDDVRADALYFGFFAIALFVSCLAYLGKALVQLDPIRAIPERVGSAFDMLTEGVVVLDDRLRVLMVNEAAARIAGTPAKALLGGRIESWPWVRGENWQSPWTTVLATGLAIGDHPVRLAFDEAASYTLTCSLIRDDDGGPNGIMLTLNDLSAIERKNRELTGTLQKLRRSQESITLKNRELEALASQDPLTGLKNRRALTGELERQLCNARETGQPLACLMVDIDHFKRINDTLGHAAGDEVICAVANTLVADSRDSDTVGRIGGEEFVVVLPDTSLADAMKLAERIRADIVRLADDQTLPVKTLSASFGIAPFAPDVETVEQLLDRADKGLYKAKESGRNRTAAFEPGSSEEKVGATDADADADGDAGAKARSARELELARELARKSRDLDELRMFDPVTRLPRRAVFVERVEKGIADATRTGTTLGVLSLGMRDGERFAATLGHEASGALAAEFARRLREGFRRTDTVSEIVDGHNLSHVGTAEFGLLLEGVGDTGDALTIMTRIRRLFAEPIVVEGTRVHAGGVIGAAFFPHDGDSAEALVARASEARLEAVRQPDRTALRFAGEALEAPSRESLEMESNLYEAVARGQFSVQYQPKLELASQRISGLEALARWEHPEKGWISPADFIPVAERNGLIDDISAFVVRTSLEALKAWHDAGFDALRIALNVSATQLRDPALVSGLLGAIQEAGVSPEHVEIELTETSVIESPQRARIALGHLRSAGVSVSMDDFGTGYTSLALLADLPLDSVKIDRSFVDTMTENTRSRAIVRSIIDMAHALGLSIIGEGVETNDQLAALAAFGCNDVQGYLIGRPLDAAGTSEFLQQQARDVPARRRA